MDLDNNVLFLSDLANSKIRLPSRERKKLISSLYKHTGMSSSLAPSKKAVPDSMKQAFPKNKLCLHSTESVLDHRKVRDIPKSMYSTFSNNFLLQKGGIKVTSDPRASLTENTSMVQGVSQSFESISASKRSLKKNPGLKIIPQSTYDDELKEARDSFVVTPRQSVDPSSIEEIEKSKGDLYLSLHDAIVEGPCAENLPVETDTGTSPIMAWFNKVYEINCRNLSAAKTDHSIQWIRNPLQATQRNHKEVKVSLKNSWGFHPNHNLFTR
jgi:hypothetical protein